MGNFSMVKNKEMGFGKQQVDGYMKANFIKVNFMVRVGQKIQIMTFTKGNLYKIEEKVKVH